MSDKTKQNPDQAPYLTFVENKVPGLKSGDYELQLSHEIAGVGIDSENSTDKPISFHFSVRGDRYSIPPTQVHSVFPPSSSLGADYHRVLPHVIFNRATLPWERFAIDPAQIGNLQETAIEKIPWLALLVFQPEELETITTPSEDLTDNERRHRAQTGRVVQLGSLKNDATGWPGVQDLEYASEDEKVKVIYVKQTTLAPLLPTADELTYLAHTRQADADENGTMVGNEMALVIANRLPKPNGTSIIHLVSMENRYQADKTFNFNSASGDDLVTLVSLKSWRIACVRPQESFSQYLHQVDHGIPALPVAPNTNAPAQDFLNAGFLPHAHYFRRGGKSISWYHGPLSPTTQNKGLDTSVFPIHSADELLRYDEGCGMFDVSYAAAWELGRLLCLQQKKVSLKLYNWKRLHVQQLRRAEQQELAPHLPFSAAAHSSKSQILPLPPEVEQWFSDISILKGVPFNYLLPDERLLPKESIRFFTLDKSWIASMVDGAFSIGRVIEADQAVDNDLKAKLGDSQTEQGTITGFVLRSGVVSGFPGMLLEGYEVETTEQDENQPIATAPLAVLRQERIAPDILLCLFQGDLKTLDLHLKPEVLHFGLDADEKGGGYHKKLRNADGTERSNEEELDVKVQLNAQRKVDVATLFSDIRTKSAGLSPGFKNFTAAQFALQMIESVPKVRFMKKA